jgi:hypothetical protein
LPGYRARSTASGQVRGRRLGNRQEMCAVRRRHGGGLVAAGLGEPFGGELTDGLQ